MSADQPTSDNAVIALAEASHEVVLILSREGRVQFANRAARTALGLPDTTADLTQVADYLVPEDRPRMLELLTKVEAERVPLAFDARFQCRPAGAAVSLSGQLVALVSPGQAPSIAVVARAAAAHLPDGSAVPASGDAAALTRLTEMFAGIVGHDLRNPLNAILTGAHLLLRQIDDATAATTLNRIIASGHRMQRMIDQLLDLARIRIGSGLPLSPSSCELQPLALQVIDEIRVAHPRMQIDFAVSGDTRGTWDCDRVMQMLSNLVGNAAQHGSGTVIHVAIDGTRTEDVTVTVHNEGEIPSAMVPVLFSPFRVVHHKRRKSGGLGLGLFVTRQVALAHGGAVTVSSTATNGTTFVVRLPRSHASVHTPAALSGLGEEDLAVLDQLATAPRATSVTAQLFGAVALHQRVPQEYWSLFERYTRVLDRSLDRQTYKGDGPEFADELRSIAEDLGKYGAGAREVAELHARALKQRTRGVPVARAQALTAEGRLVSFQLMGYLLSFYRRRAGVLGDEAS